jgi:hypothetical protein
MAEQACAVPLSRVAQAGPWPDPCLPACLSESAGLVKLHRSRPCVWMPRSWARGPWLEAIGILSGYRRRIQAQDTDAGGLGPAGAHEAWCTRAFVETRLGSAWPAPVGVRAAPAAPHPSDAWTGAVPGLEHRAGSPWCPTWSRQGPGQEQEQEQEQGPRPANASALLTPRLTTETRVRQALCAAGCVGFDRLSARYSVSLPLGADGGGALLVGAVDDETAAVRVDDARGGGIVAGKSMLVDTEVWRGGGWQVAHGGRMATAVIRAGAVTPCMCRACGGRTTAPATTRNRHGPMERTGPPCVDGPPAVWTEPAG